ncbi:AAA family ATPase [Methyloversatilis sp.]|uniref:AAA family ATPase n=1 Tax=Methyloversatilis sp. TaxID=2569862 RepID=UPI0035B1E985
MHPETVDLSAWRARALEFERQLNAVLVGMPRTVRLMTIAVFARGHVLLEGDVGVGKTTLLKAVARGIGGAYQRIEGTVDLMPGDLVYHTYVGDDGRPRVEPGPLIAQGSELAVFFFNEINRARPQVHALLLRLMAERTVSAFNREYTLPWMQVFADRNRVEREETFELPSAARDRFLMEVSVEAPDAREQLRGLMFDTRFHDADALIAAVEPGMLDHTRLNGVAQCIQNTVQSAPALDDYGVDLWLATRRPADYGVRLSDVDIDRFVLSGASPRGVAMLARAARVQAWLEGRDRLVPEDLHAVFFEAIAHRLCLSPVYETQRPLYARPFVTEVLRQVASP